MSTQSDERTGVPLDTLEVRLVIARMHAGRITAEDAAARVGVSGQTWRNWEAGQVAGARREAMMRHIARQLDVNYVWLRDGGPLTVPDTDGPGSHSPTASVPEGRLLKLVAA